MAHTDTHAHRGASVRHRNAADLHPRYRAQRGTPAPEGVFVQMGAHMVTRPVLRPGKTARKAAAKRVTATYEALRIAEANAFAAEAHYGERHPETRAYWAAHEEAFAAFSAACSEARYQRALAQLR